MNKSSTIVLTTMPYAAFSAETETMTFVAIQDVLAYAYLTLYADPAYLFLHKDDKKRIADDIIATVWRPWLASSQEEATEGVALSHHVVGMMAYQSSFINYSTGTSIDMIELAGAKTGTLLFGFFKY